MRTKAAILILTVLLIFTGAALATEKWQTVPVEPGQGVFVPCSSALVTVYVLEGMAVVECHAPETTRGERVK
jgi:hypothetical protein